MKYSNSIEYNISTKLDSSGLTKLQTQIREVELSLQKMSNAGNFAPTIEKARSSLQGLNKALTEAFNPSLGIIDISKFRAELAAGKVDLESVASGFRLAGTQGQTAFNSLIGQLGRFDAGITRTSSAVDKMFVTFQNTFRWGVISSFFSQFMNAIHSSVEYARELDDSLTQIMLVTDYSRDSMNEYAKAANEAAKAVGQTTVGMTNASLIFAQQGYDLDQSQQLATLSAKLANASQQDTAATSDQITAYMNAYGLQDNMEELAQAMDNWALIANISAADVEEIAVASQRAASMANAVGVSGEALAAQIATIESVTREAPEQIGNGLKTLYARFSDLQLGKEDEDGIGLGKVTSTLQQIGVQVLDSLGNVRSMDDIMEDLMAIWQDLDDTTQEAVAQTLAGKHQVNRFTALMDNADMYQEYLGATGENASGTLEQMNQEYMDSLQGRMATLQATLESLFNDVFTTDMIYPLIDALTKLAEVFDTLFKSVGGGPTIILGLASAFTRLFSKNIANAITDASMNRELSRIQAENYKNAPAALNQLGLANPNANNENTRSLLNFAQQGAQFSSSMSEEGLKQYNSLLDENVRLTNAAENAHKEFTDTLSSLNAILGTTIQETDAIFTDENGLNTSVLTEVLRELKDSDFDGNKTQIDAAITKVQKYITALEDLETEIKEYKKVEDSTGEGSTKINDAVQQVREAAIALGEAGGLSKEQLEALENSINDVDTQTENWENEAKDALVEIQRLAGGAENLKKILEQLAQSNSISPEKARALADQLDRTYSNDQAAQGAKDNIDRLGQGFIDTQKIAASRKEILDTIGAIGQLAFAIQSLGNLPSIWRDKDLSNAEKFYQTITNLTAALPNLITSFGQVSKAMEKILSVAIDVGENIIKTINIEAIEKEAQAQEKLNMVKAEGAITETSDAAATGADAAAKEADTVATTGATVAQQGLNAATLAFPVTAIIAAIALVVTWLSKWRAEQQALFQERLDVSNEQAENTKKELDNIEKLYEAWQKTGQGADELRQALEDQAEALGIVVTAADNYDTLREKIEKATAAQLEYNASLRRENTEAPEYNFSAASQLNDEDRERLGITTVQRGHSRGRSSQRASYAAENPAETLQTAREMRDEAANQMLENQRDMMRTTDEGRDTELQAENAELQQQIGLYDVLIQQNQDAYNYNKETVETAVQASALYGNAAFEQAQSYEEMMTYLQTIEGFSELTLEDQIALAQQAAEWAGNLEAAADAELRLVEEQIQDNDLVPNIPGAEVHKGESGFAQLNRFGEDFNLSNEDLLKVSDMIDWSDPDVDQKVHDLLATIQAAMNDEGLSLEEAITNQGIQQGTISDEEILKQERDDKGYVGEDWDRDTESVKEYADSLQELAEISDDIDDSLKSNRKAAIQIADANARLNKGIKALSDNWADWNDIISDTTPGIEATEEYSEALNGTKEALTNIFDFDISAGLADSTQFIKDNLELIQAAAEGDMQAIEALRVAAAQQIIIDADLDWDQLNVSQQDLFNLIAEFNAEEIEVGATLDDTSFGEALLAMMESLNLSVAEMQKVFDSLGWEPDIQYKDYAVADASKQTTDGTIEIVDPEAEGGVRTVKVSDVVTFNDDNTVTIPTINASGTTYQGSAARVSSPSSRGGGGGGGGKKSCFVAGTLVSLQNSFKEIEKIQVGDIVLSYNEENHQNEYSKVLQTMIHNTTEEIYDLYIEDEILSVTGIHRFYIRRKHDIEWIMASELNIGDYVLFANGNWHIISNINVKIQTTTVYNFEVSDNHNYYVGHNQILAHNKGGKGGGGGGGGKAKTIQPKEKKEHKKNYYEKVNSQLDKLKEQLSGIEKQEDKLIGDKARANQQKQINLISKEIKLEKERLKILQDTADSELKDVKAAMKAKDKLAEDILKGRGINFNIPAPQYDENGIITNYEDISAKIDKAHNELIKQYNDAAAAGNEDLTKTIDEAIKKYDEYSAAILENAQRQNDIQKEIESTKNTIQELKDSITDINIELYKTSMETVDNLKDLNEKWAEFQGLLTGMPSDSPFRDLNVDLLKLNSTFEISKDTARNYYQEIINGKIAAQKATKDKTEKEAIQASINYFTGLRDGLTDDMLKNGLLGLAMTDLEQLEKWYKNPSLKDNPFGDNQKALVEAYQEGYERVLELSQDWQDLQKDIVEDVIDGFDEIADKQDRQLEKYERLAEELENLADIYTLSYGDESYKALSDIGKRQAETLKAQLGQYVNIYNYWQEEYQKALDTGNEELANSIEDRMNDIQDEMRDIAQESAETFVEAYENAIDAAVQNMYQGLFDENNLDHLDRNWEWDKKVIDNYRDEVEKTFEIEQLRSKYNDLLNDAQSSSLATQNKIRKQMQEQLDLLKNQESVSEYDVELANSKLLILQKQIALEDAQQNKNQMQLRRDSQGNYRYVYRASQNDIAKARQEYIQAVQDAYELTKEQRQKTAEELGNTLKDYANEWADLNKNMNLTEEERIKQSQELTEKFLDYMKHLNEDLADSQLGMSDVLNFMVENGTADVAAAAQEMLGQLFDDQGNLIEDTDIAWWDFGNDLAKKLFPYIQDATSTMNNTLTTEAEELRDKLTGPDGVITDVKKALIDEETGLRPALEDATNAIIGENGLNNAMDSLADSFENQNEKLTEGMDNIKKYTEGLAAAIDWLKTAQNAIKDLQNVTVGELVSETSATAPKNAKPAATTKSATNATTSNTLDESRVQAAYNDIMSGRAGNDSTRWAYLTKQGYSEREQKAAQAAVNAVYAGTAMTTAIKNAAAKYDTGGYTGEWNKDGRLAILHQKELVLNAQDTRNILSAVDIVRQMTSTLGNALTNYSMGSAKQGFLTSTLGGVDQRVEIKAEFPNVRDAFEIETALTSLADKAYQYAHRNI